MGTSRLAKAENRQNQGESAGFATGSTQAEKEHASKVNARMLVDINKQSRAVASTKCCGEQKQRPQPVGGTDVSGEVS